MLGEFHDCLSKKTKELFYYKLVATGCQSPRLASPSWVLLGFIEEKFDLVVSGIKPHANNGNDVTYSGTVTAAFEAAISGLPAVAFSLDSPENSPGDVDYSVAGVNAVTICQQVNHHGLPKKQS